jgi:hypothetical protein
MAKSQPDPPPLEPRDFRSPEEIEAAIAKLRRQIEVLNQLDIQKAIVEDNGADDVAGSNVRATIRAVFGTNSPEFHEHQYIRIWAGGQHFNMSRGELILGSERGRLQVITILNGLIGRLEEKRTDFGAAGLPAPSTYFDRLNLHPRILEVSRDRFIDGYPWDAVLAASKALVNYVKERSDRYDLDGAPLMRAVFSKNAPASARLSTSPS